MKARLDTRYLKTITVDNDRITRHWDTEIPGYLLQVSKAGTMTFYYRYQLDGIRHTYKIGRYPKLTATQARSLAKIKSGEVLTLAVRIQIDPVNLTKTSNTVNFYLNATDQANLTVAEQARFIGPLIK